MSPSLPSCLCVWALAGCNGGPQPLANTCQGPYPNYWQDPAFAETGMWDGQEISNQPPADWTGPVFALSQSYPTSAVNDSLDRGWTAYDPFAPDLSAEEKAEQASAYIWAVMRYLQAGNVSNGAGGGDVEQDWTLCENEVRSWFHMPWQTYEPLSGREFVHGLTREAPVTFVLSSGDTLHTTMWAVAFFNAVGSYRLGQVWRPDGEAAVPKQNVLFPNGTVIGKLLFTTASPDELPFLRSVPKWRINLSDPTFCVCRPAAGEQSCSFGEMSRQCPRSPGDVYLAQFDVAVRDDRAPTGWAFGTFVADGEAKADESNPWNRISALGLMWANDPPPPGHGAIDFPADPRLNGFVGGVVFWDVVDRLNAVSDAGHLGCNQRLNGPADNPRSSCLSCHMTGSVPDQDLKTPPIFDIDTRTGQCLSPANPQVDGRYFANTPAATPFSTDLKANYETGRERWIATDYSLQLSIALGQFGHWVEHRDSLRQRAAEEPGAERKLKAVLPAR